MPKYWPPAGGGGADDDSAYATLASPALTGHPTGVTESAGDNSTRLSTTAYVATAVAAVEGAFMLGKAGAIGATETNAADNPFIVPFGSTLKRMKVVLKTAASGSMTVQLRKAASPGTAVPSYADMAGFVATFASGSSIGTVTPGTALTVAEGDLLNFSAATGSGVDMAIVVVKTTP